MRVYDSFKNIKSISHVTLYNPGVWYLGEWGDTGSYLDFPDSPHGNRDEYQSSRRQEYPSRGGGGGSEYNQSRSSQERPLPQQRFSNHHAPRYTSGGGEMGYVSSRQQHSGYDDSSYAPPQHSDCPTCGHANTESYPPPLPRRPKSDGRGYNSERGGGGAPRR